MAGTSKRERELARQRYERRRMREAQRRAQRRRRATVVGSVVATLAVLAGVVALAITLAGGDGKKSTATPGTTPSATVAAGDCTYQREQPRPGQASPKDVGLPPAKPAKADKTATITLTQGGKPAGTVTVDLLGSKAPCTVNSFDFLAGKKYFDGTTCHRLTTSGIFVLQCGDPSGTGSGGPGYQFADENLTGATYPAGTVAMANAGPGTNGSQFFIVYKDTQLSPNYTPFGKVTKGLDVVDKIAKAGATGTDGDGKPKQEVKITSFRVS